RVLQTADTPRLVDPGSFTVAEGDTIHHVFEVDDPDLPDDVFTFSDSSDWLDIDASTGEMSWIPDETQVGPHRLLVSVVDRFGLSDSININIMVTDVNQAPSITSALEIDTVQDEKTRYNIRAEDPDVPFGDHISYEAFADGIVINVESATGIMSFTPTDDLVPSFEITLRVTDDLGEQTEAVLLVNVENKNDPPELMLTALLTYDQGEEVSIQLEVIDPDLDLDLEEPETITFETTGPDEMVADQEGRIRFTADQSLVGEHSVVYIVIDRAGARDSINVVFTVLDVNDVPEITNEPSGTTIVDEDEELVIQLEGIDLDDDTITWSDDSDLVDIDPATGRIVFTPGQDEVGSHIVTITLSDGRGGEAIVVLNIEVENVNDAPEITSMLPTTGTKVKAGKTITLSSTAFDEDGDALTYTWKDGDTVLGTGD
ncbi:MAG: tandem-95 repeat protein, partial [Thermoplasmata archaeon]|nr:tandem-95 repeat protein [Thermoplasmata archaeon]